MGCPSRSFFPRGFLWDEGFHQLLVGRWDPAISRDVISHWFSTMRSNGWIPREQMLGAEALSKVPDWAVAQHPSHANPPTFLLAIEGLLEGAKDEKGAVDADTARWLSTLFPAVEKWFQWFRASQKGTKPNSFRWHGRDLKDGKLNAMTLSSGLDDYPRASSVSDEERHVDLHSWIALGANVLASIGETAGLPQAKIEEYKRMSTQLVETLGEMHWDDRRKRYSDFGLHSNKGKFVKHIVVKCGTRDKSESVEHMLAVEHYQELQRGVRQRPPCPDDYPAFMFPLGDGQGGLMMREKFVPDTGAEERLQFVDNAGYVNFFPFILRLMSPSDSKVEHLMDLFEPARGIWSDFGLRSMSSKDQMYLRDNAPGDAPYWRGPIWININYLAVRALQHYASIESPWQDKALEKFRSLRKNLVDNLFKNFEETGYLWEQYNPTDGKGQRTHPFNGWSSLVVLMM